MRSERQFLRAPRRRRRLGCSRAPFDGHPHGHYGEMTLRPFFMELYLNACLKRLDTVLKET